MGLDPMCGLAPACLALAYEGDRREVEVSRTRKINRFALPAAKSSHEQDHRANAEHDEAEQARREFFSGGQVV